MKKPKFKKILTPILAGVMLLSACSEGAAGGGVDYAKLSDVEFWSTYSTEKVIQNNVSMYDAIKQDAVIDVTAIRGEEEAGQIIMTAGNKPVKEYDIVLSDLAGQNNAVFSKNNIKVYHELYIEVGAAGEYYTTAGFYPDALAPFEGVKAVKETGFDKNSNQGLYISFDVPENQPAGTYTGSVGVVINGQTKNIPVTLNVPAVTIGKETHVASSFLNEWYFYRGELDTTEDMYDKYNKALFDYRLGCNNVTVYEEDVDYYAEKVCEYAALIECPGYNIPWFSKNYSSNPYNLNGRDIVGPHAYDIEKLCLYLRVIADKGLETGVDPFKKAFIYGWDEPDLSFGTDRAAIYVKEWSYIVKQCKKIVLEELAQKSVSADKKELLDDIIESLDNLPHLVLSNKFLNMEIDLDEEEISYGPYFSALGGQASRDRYRLGEGNPLWWYGCTAPRSPNPTYHIDDTVLSARIESWMKADYNIQGNLYWSTCLYSEPGQAEAITYPENFYTGNAARSLSVNGEGFLFYPGKKYGVDGPIPSLRLEQIRDGLEEYEMIYSLKQIYGEVGALTGETGSEEEIMSYLYDTLYSGTYVSTTHTAFAAARKALLSLTELAQSDAKVCILDVTAGRDYTFKIFVKDGYTLKQDGVALENGKAVNGGKVYDMVLKVSEGKKLNLSVEVGGRTLGLYMNFGSASTNYNAAYAMENGIIKQRATNSNTVATELVNATIVNSAAEADEKYIKLLLGEASTAIQDFVIDSEVIRAINTTDDKLVIRLFNAGEPVNVEFMIRRGSDKGWETKGSMTLENGINSISFNGLSGYNYNKIGYIDGVRVRIGAKGDSARDYIYFVDMTVYKV